MECFELADTVYLVPFKRTITSVHSYERGKKHDGWQVKKKLNLCLCIVGAESEEEWGKNISSSLRANLYYVAIGILQYSISVSTNSG